MNDNDEVTKIAMKIILAAGDARNLINKAVKEKAVNLDFDGADFYMKKAKEKLVEAHNAQTSIVQNEAAGKKYEYSLLMTHAMDTVMTITSEFNITENVLMIQRKGYEKYGK
jgi:PTS system cellobiose-specific IIA component